MKLLPKAALLVTALSCSTASQALDYYISAQAGNSDLEFAEDTEVYLALGAGISTSKNFSYEISYNDFGEYENKGTYGTGTANAGKDWKLTANVSSIALAAIGKMNITDDFYLTGKVGFDFWELEQTTTLVETGDKEKTDSNGTDLFMAFGLTYDLSELTSFTKGVLIGFEYQIHDFDKLDIDVYTGTLIYRF